MLPTSAVALSLSLSFFLLFFSLNFFRLLVSVVDYTKVSDVRPCLDTRLQVVAHASLQQSALPCFGLLNIKTHRHMYADIPSPFWRPPNFC
jgi:hypothetical protein